jgi:hypothetical protein
VSIFQISRSNRKIVMMLGSKKIHGQSEKDRKKRKNYPHSGYKKVVKMSFMSL